MNASKKTKVASASSGSESGSDDGKSSGSDVGKGKKAASPRNGKSSPGAVNNTRPDGSDSDTSDSDSDWGAGKSSNKKKKKVSIMSYHLLQPSLKLLYCITNAT